MDRIRKLELESSTLRTRLLQFDEERDDILRSYRGQIAELQGENASLKVRCHGDNDLNTNVITSLTLNAVK